MDITNRKTRIEITETIWLPLSEVCFSFARSSGPGGQNVNKVNSKVTLHWQIFSSSLPPSLLARLVKLFPNRINSDGELVIACDSSREQPRNKEECLKKLQLMLRKAATKPKRRVATKPTKASKERRLETKQRQSRKKALRSSKVD